MSTTSAMESQHIVEAMTQILCTRPMERCMEYHFKSEIDSSLFEPNNASIKNLLSYQVKEALKELEDRIFIDFINVISEDSSVIAEITFTILSYGTSHTTRIKVGDLSV